MSRLLTLFPPNRGRIAMANNCNLPLSYNYSNHWVQNCWTRHKSGPAGYSAVEVTFVNGIISTNSEQNGPYDFILRAGLYLPFTGQFLRLQFDGLDEISVAKEWGTVQARANVTIPPGVHFYVTNRRVAADNGAAGNYNVITNTSGITARQDGVITGTDTSKDYTLGVGLAYGAACLQPPTINAGALVNAVVDPARMGSGYTAGLQLAPWYGPAGAGQPGALAPGNFAGGYGNISDGKLSSITFTSGGSGHDAAKPPLFFVGGSGNPVNGFGNVTAAYGPSLITGIPRRRAPSVLILGDSIGAGYGSVDGQGDLNGNYGCYEQALANRYGVHKLAVSGESSAGWIGNSARMLSFIDDQIRRGYRPSYVLIALGTNDFLTNTFSNVVSAVQSYVDGIAQIWRARGAKILMTTIAPANTTSANSNRFKTVAEQSPYNVNYQTGGRVEQYNAALLNGSGPKNDGVIDASSLMRDATVTSAWRVDCFGGGTAFCTDDGVHPSVGVGIPYITSHLDVSVIR